MFQFVLDCNTPVVRVCIKYIEPDYIQMSIDPRDWDIPDEDKPTLVYEFQEWLKENDYRINYEASIRLNYSAIPTYVVYIKYYRLSDGEMKLISGGEEV